ncbi:hypothetical protein BH10ACI3_BH10ACI3_18300 [soil metagenome]
MNLSEEFKARGPWVTKFKFDDIEYGGEFDAVNDSRVDDMFEAFPNAKSVLELGSLEGGHSFAMAKRPSTQSVLALEARSQNIERATFVNEVLRNEKVKFIEADIEKTELADFGKFDVVFCSGLLYHLMEPWKLVEQCRQISPNIYISTQYACENEAKRFSNGYRGKWYREGGWLDPLSGVSKYSFWLSMGSLINLLTKNGFGKITIHENNLSHPNGCAVNLSASA